MNNEMATTDVKNTENENENESACLDEPPATNVKCIVFTIFVVVIYWYLPRNKWLLLLLSFLPYLLMSWYDHIYLCERNLGPTYLQNFYQPFKPRDGEQRLGYDRWCPKWTRLVLIVDTIVLILFLIFFFTFFLKWQPKN